MCPSVPILLRSGSSLSALFLQQYRWVPRALRPVYGGGAEVREAILRPQSAVPSETIAVVGPGSKPRVTPCLVGDAGQPRQKQEAQIIEVGDRFGPDCGFYSGNVCLRLLRICRRLGIGYVEVAVTQRRNDDGH